MSTMVGLSVRVPLVILQYLMSIRVPLVVSQYLSMLRIPYLNTSKAVSSEETGGTVVKRYGGHLTKMKPGHMDELGMRLGGRVAGDEGS